MPACVLSRVRIVALTNSRRDTALAVGPSISSANHRKCSKSRVSPPCPLLVKFEQVWCVMSVYTFRLSQHDIRDIDINITILLCHSTSPRSYSSFHRPTLFPWCFSINRWRIPKAARLDSRTNIRSHRLLERLIPSVSSGYHSHQRVGTYSRLGLYHTRGRSGVRACRPSVPSVRLSRVRARTPSGPEDPR